MRDIVTDPLTLDRDVATPLLAASALCYDAGGKRLIDNVTLSIRPRCRTVIMGANGAGKSLLLRLLHGLLEPTEGTILWHGWSPDRTARLAQAMVFQNPVMLRRSVQANLRFALAAHGIRGKECAEQTDRALVMARLTHMARSPARVLSGGEQQRLAVARALICKPDLLFLDEPTSSLDPASTQMIEDLVNAAHAQGVTIVMVTHDLGQARRMGDDVIFLHSGQVAECGALADVLAQPTASSTKAWLEGRLYTAKNP